MVDVSIDRVTVPVNGVYTPRILDDRGNDLKDLNLRATPASVTVQVQHHPADPVQGSRRAGCDDRVSPTPGTPFSRSR